LENVAVNRGDNIRMDLEGIGCEVMYWIQLSQNTDDWQDLINTVMNPQPT